MTPLLLVFLGAAALWLSHHCFARSYAGKGASVEAVVGTLAAAHWAVFTFASQDINVFDDSGNPATVDVDALLFLGLAATVVMLLFVFQAATNSLRDVDTLDVEGVHER